MESEFQGRPGRAGPERLLQGTAPPPRQRSAKHLLAEETKTQLQHNSCSLSTNGAQGDRQARPASRYCTSPAALALQPAQQGIRRTSVGVGGTSPSLQDSAIYENQCGPEERVRY